MDLNKAGSYRPDSGPRSSNFWNRSVWVEWPTMSEVRPLQCGSLRPVVGNWAYFDNECELHHDGKAPKVWTVAPQTSGRENNTSQEQDEDPRAGTLCLWVKLLAHDGATLSEENVIWQMVARRSSIVARSNANDTNATTIFQTVRKLSDGRLEARISDGVGQVRLDYNDGRLEYERASTRQKAGIGMDGLGDPRNATSWQHLCYSWRQGAIAEFYVNAGKGVSSGTRGQEWP